MYQAQIGFIAADSRASHKWRFPVYDRLRPRYRGLWAAEIINILRESDTGLQLYCVLPHEEQATKWAPYLRERYFGMLEKCTYMSAVHIHKSPAAQIDAYKNIIRQSDIVLAVYDPASTRGDDIDKAMAYAVAKQKQIILIHPDTFWVTKTIIGK